MKKPHLAHLTSHSRTLRQLLPEDFNDNLSVEDIIPSLSPPTSPEMLAQKLALSQMQEEQRRQMDLQRETEVRLQEVLHDDDSIADAQSSSWSPPVVLEEVVLQGRPRPRPKPLQQ